MKRVILITILAAAVAAAAMTRAQAQSPLGAQISYQGQLRLNGAPVHNVTCDVQFALFDAPSGGAQIGPTLTRAVHLRNGLFSVADLDFGAAAFEGAARWMGLSARCPSGSGAFVALSPRSPIVAVPYAHALRPGSATRGNLPNGVTVVGHNQATSGVSVGVRGRSDSSDGHGVHGWNTATGGVAIGVMGQTSSVSGRGVYGLAGATSGQNFGVFGESPSPQGYGVVGMASAISGTNYGVAGVSRSPSGYGVWGHAEGSAGANYGVVGWTNSTAGTGVIGIAAATSGQNYGVRGATNSAAGYAGYFEGRVHVIGNLSATGLKSFRIPHPTLPGHDLYHYAQESPRPENVYSGIAELDAAGAAVIALPDYFVAINAPPYRYLLTPIGAPMAELHVAEEVRDGRFKVAGGAAGKRVSWVLIAQRADALDAPVVARAEGEIAPAGANTPGRPIPPEVVP
jgi:hypothetical protein